ncbi:hypothetical protein DVH24_040722 [Malus domestica]|uniref:PPIase cyclophilin-type domain-containing protein n=1 Tax=Malus domestica TaxID=3750 RepID=A0A498IC44_MALDO|nr:hypothetical protein DVH24_040722 [Malus domestica]
MRWTDGRFGGKMLNRKSALIGLISCFYFHSTFLTSFVAASSPDPLLGSARVVFQTNYGDIEFGFYPTVAPKTVEHIFKLVRLGGYNTNHIFRVEKGFVAQVADVASGRSAPMNEEQLREAEKTVVGEFSAVKHVRGILSMGRYEDPNSAGSSFSMLLGDSPHLDGKYAIFGKVTKGDETLRALEELPTHREGIFVMPTERITILSTYYYDTEMEHCEHERSVMKQRLAASAVEIERQQANIRMKRCCGCYQSSRYPLYVVREQCTKGEESSKRSIRADGRQYLWCQSILLGNENVTVTVSQVQVTLDLEMPPIMTYVAKYRTVDKKTLDL